MSLVVEDVSAKPAPRVKCVLKIMGTQSSGFRYRNGVLLQSRLDDVRELTHDQAQRLAEYYLQLIAKNPTESPV